MSDPTGAAGAPRWRMRVVREGDEEIVPGPLLARALTFLADAEIDVEVLGPELCAGSWGGGEHGPVHLVVRTIEAREQLCCYARWPEVVPEARRPQVMELCTRINVDMPTTWMELDLDEGRVSARSGVSLMGVGLTDDTVAENAVTLALDAMDAFAPAVRAVALGGLDVADIHA